ncbi:MAG: BMP family protein [Anaerolineaceae bacterium]
MKWQKRTALMTTLIIIAALLIPSLAGCSPATASTSEAAAPAATEASEPAAAATESAAPTESAAEPLKVALMLSSPATDSGWNATAYKGLKQLESEYGAEISLSESIPTSDNEAVYRDYASRGYDLIIGNSFSFGEAAMKVAPDFPDTKFAVTTGIWGEGNVASYYPLLEDYYTSGAMDALMTKTGKIGLIGGVDIPSMRATMNAFIDGAKSINPDVEISVAYVGSWADPAKAKELALAQIASGVDVIDGSSSTSFTGIIEAVKETYEKEGKIVYVVGDVALDASLAPENIIGAHTQNFDGMVLYFYGLVKDGTFKGEIYRPGLASGLIDVLMTDLVPTDVQEKVNAVKQQFVDGKLTVTEKFE